MCCCKKILSLCDVPVCGGFISTGLNAPATGTYSLVIDFLQIGFTIKVDIDEGQEIKFPVSGLNENYTFEGKVMDAEGNVLSITKDDIQYDCISFSTKLSYDL